MAYGIGADFLEQDLVATRDHQLVVLHDIYLDHVSDVTERFPGRKRDDGHYYVVDFTLAELIELHLHERHHSETGELLFPGRFPFQLPSLRVTSFIEEMQLIAGLNATTGRRVGIYPEIKAPAWHESASIDLTRLVHETLVSHRSLLTGPVFIQSFSADALRRLKIELATEWPLVQLLDRKDADSLARDRDAIGRIAEYAAAIGCPAEALIESDDADRGVRPTQLARALAAARIPVHPYTLRRDQPLAGGVDYIAALRLLIHELKVEAIFCDQPDDALRIRDCSAV